MAVDQTLVDELMKLDDQERLEVARLLIATANDQDTLDDDERGRLDAALDRSLKDIAAGRVLRSDEVLEELRARHQR